MHLRIVLLVLICLGMADVQAAAGTVYEDGPINGTVDAWTINFGYFVGDSFTVSGATSSITGFSFGAWLYPGDTLHYVQLTIESEPGGGTIYFDQIVAFTASGCTINLFGFNVCTESGTFQGPVLSNGTYWAMLQNAVTQQGNPVYWDENSGIGCHSLGCPSETFLTEGTIPAESFTVLGNPAGTTPEASNIMLFGSGIVCFAGLLWQKLWRN